MLPYSIGNEQFIKIDRKSGLGLEEAWFNFVYQPVYDVNRAITGIFTFIYEVTDQVKARMEIVKANEELQRLNSELNL